MTHLFVESLKTQPQHKRTAAFRTPRALSQYDRRLSAATHPTCLSQSINPSSLAIRHDVLTNRQHITVAKHCHSLHPAISRWSCTQRPQKKKRGNTAQIPAPQMSLPPPAYLTPLARLPRDKHILASPAAAASRRSPPRLRPCEC